MKNRDPIQALMKALSNYLLKHGRRILSITSILGQDKVRISIESLYWYHNISTGYRYLEDAIKDILSDKAKIATLNDKGINIVKIKGNFYIEVPRQLIKQLARNGK